MVCINDPQKESKNPLNSYKLYRSLVSTIQLKKKTKFSTKRFLENEFSFKLL